MKRQHCVKTKYLIITLVIMIAVLTPLLLTFTPAALGAGTFVPTGSNGTARYGHTATLLPNGKVLVAGGYNNIDGYLTSAELYDPATGTFSPTGSMGTARFNPSATLLPNGKVLLAGGILGPSGHNSSAELYDPASGTFSPTGSMGTARSVHTANLLPSGKVLVVGGENNSGGLASAELYDPATGTFGPTGVMGTARRIHTATLLPNGRVLVSGGANNSGGSLASAELYDPATGTFSPTGSMGGIRYAHVATLLPNGMVFVAGGNDTSTYPGTSLTSAELYDPATETFSATGSMGTARGGGHTATLLPNGEVLVAGGGNNSGSLASAELYDPATGTFSATGSMSTARFVYTATLLTNGKVLVAGGFNNTDGHLASAEVYSPVVGTLTSITVTPADPTTNVGQTQQFAATGTLSDGSAQPLPLPSAWTQLFPLGGPPPGRARHSYNAYDPSSNRLIIFGGWDSSVCCSLTNDVWVLTNANGLGGTPEWINLTPRNAPGSPSPRVDAQSVYDQATNRLIIFGGADETNDTLAEVWVLTNANGLGGTPTWTMLSPTGAPPLGRLDNKIAYDGTNNLLIVFGGVNWTAGTLTPLNDVWILTHANGLGGTPAWVQLFPTGTPPSPRSSYGGFYDQSNNRFVVFGGCTDATYNCQTTDSELWVLENANGLGGTPAWSPLAYAGGPPTASGALTGIDGYDPATNSYILFGGWSAGQFTKNETWVLHNANGLGGTPQWTQLFPSNPPSARVAGTRLYDASTNRFIVFGGLGGQPVDLASMSNDLWVLTNANGSGQVTWSSSHPDVATIDQAGLATGLSPGTTTITAKITPPAGLVGWWPGDGNANDLAGTNNGTVTNGATFVPGASGQAFGFDGVDDLIRVNDAPSLGITGPFSIDAWVRLNTSNPGPILWKGSDSGSPVNSPYSLVISTAGNLEGWIGDGVTFEGVSSSMAFPLGTFVHVAFVADGTTLNLYINGELTATAPQTILPYDSPFNLQIGSVEGGSIGGLPLTLDGIVDELKLYARALSQAEIQRIVSEGSVSGSTTLTVVSPNQPPVANFTVTPNPAACGQVVGFDGSASYASSGRSIVLYEWDFDYNGNFTTDAVGSMVAHSYPLGTYTAALRVTDDNVPPQTAISTASVQINVGNQPPVANPGGPYTIDQGSNLILDGSASSDPNIACGDAIVSYEWDIGNDGTFEYSSAMPTITIPQADLISLPLETPITLGLRITDSLGASGTASTTITIQPSVTLSVTPVDPTINIGQTLQFTALGVSFPGGQFTPTTPLPEGYFAHKLVADSGFLYHIGGIADIGGILSANKVYFAPIQNDGSIGDWIEGPPLPSRAFYHAAVAWNETLYVLGGDSWSESDGFVMSNAVYYSRLNPDGRPGAWQTTTSLPEAVLLPGASVWNGTVYVTGGLPSPGEVETSSVFSATVQPDGSLGPWVAQPSLPIPIYVHAAVADADTLYVLGGATNSGSTILNAVYYSPINSDNSLAGWATTTSLPQPLGLHQAAVINGRIYVTGGDNGTMTSDTAISAGITPDGTLSNWSQFTTLTMPLSQHGQAATDEFLFVSGGGFCPPFPSSCDGGQQSAVYVMRLPKVTWSSSDTAVATIDQNGLATGLSPGVTTITATSGSVSGSTTLTVNSNHLPLADAGPDQIVEATSASGASVTLNGSGSSDQDGDPITYNWTGPFDVVSEVSPAVTIPLGTHTVALTVGDGQSTATDTVLITVRDTTPPVIAAHADVTAEAISAAGAMVSYTSPSTSDAVDGPGVATCSPSSGSTLPLGNTTVTCNATDAHGNAAAPITFVVHVVDTTAPVVTCPLNVIAEATGPTGTILTYGAATATDAISTPTITYSQASGTLFPIGVTTVTVTATDAAGNSSTCSFTVTVQDTTSPELVMLGLGTDSIITFSPIDVMVQASDLVGIASVTVNGVSASLVTGTPQSGTWRASVPISLGGTLTINVSATDDAGHATSATAIVDNDGIDAVVDKNRVTGVDESQVFSNDFNDGVTSGTIVDRGRWTVQVTGIPQSFTPTGSMGMGRAGHTATLLPSGKVLIAGGRDGSGTANISAELYGPATGAFTMTGSMGTGRYNHTATLLPNGQVLLVGGFDSSGIPSASAELYDPATGVFSATGSMAAGRAHHNATLLPSGQVLIAGGFSIPGGPLGSAELYDPASGLFTPTGTMGTARWAHTATLLSNGQVLIAGGATGNGVGFASAELYDPATGVFSPTGAMGTARFYHTATPLPGGKVLVTGGLTSSCNGFLASAEIYDSATGMFGATGSMSAGRYAHAATLLANGQVLITGGLDSCAIGSLRLRSVETFNPDAGTFAAIESMSTGRSSHMAILLRSDRVLISGGGAGSDLAAAELFVPEAVRLSVVGAGSVPARIAACGGTYKEVRLDRAGEAADIRCSSDRSITATAVSAHPVIEVWKQFTTTLPQRCYPIYDYRGRLVGENCVYTPVVYWEKAVVPTGNTITTGSPFTASPDNTQPVLVEFADEHEAVFGSFQLDPGESVDVNFIVNEFVDQDTVQVTVLSGTVTFTIRGLTTTLSAGQSQSAPAVNLPPVASAGPDQIVEATSAAGATVTLDGTGSSDPNGEPLTFSWSGPFGTVTAQSPAVPVPLGISTITVTVTDPDGLTGTATVQVTIRDSTPPLVTASADLTVEATSAAGTIVIYTSPATSDAVDGAGVASCLPASDSMFPLGQTTVTCTATDAHGNAAAPTSFVVYVVDTTPPSINVTNPGSGIYNCSVAIAFSAIDTASSVASVSATLNGVAVSDGQILALTKLGLNTLSITATDSAGNSSTQTVTFSVTYNFIGFLDPINSDGSSIFKVGSTVPIKYQLTDCNGVAVTTASGALVVFKITDAVIGTVQEVSVDSSGVSNTDNLFRYSEPNYIYNFGTKAYSQGTYRLQATLDDGTVHIVNISLKVK